MGSFNSNVSIKNSNLKKQMFQKDSVHITTNDFFYMCPAFSREVAQNEDVKVSMSCFSRATPMAKPAYVDVVVKNRAFFIPYRSVYPQFNDFLTENKSFNGAVNQAVPVFYAIQFYGLLHVDVQTAIDSNTSSHFTVAYTGSDDNCDIVLDYTGDTQVPSASRHKFRFNFTPLGKHFWHILTGLGYNLPLHVLTKTIRSLPALSALPLLSMLRVWSDWFRPTNFETALTITPSGSSTPEAFNVERFFSESFWVENIQLMQYHIYLIGQWLLMIPFERDYFNIAQPRPLGSSTSSSLSMGDPTDTVANNAVVSNSSPNNYTPYIYDTHGSGASITRWTLQAVTALSNWMRRNQIAGYRTLDRYLAQYGTKLNSDALERSVYLGEQTVPLNINSVMSNSDTYDPTTEVGSMLGDYAGMGTVDPRNSQGGVFTYNANEFGQLIIVSQFIPKTSYYQGVKREMFHVGRFDFFNGDFDALDYQAMPLAELVVLQNLMESNVDGVNFASVYGFVPRYAEYKQSTNQDILDGDFRVHNAGANTYKDMHLFRELPLRASMSVSREYEIATWNNSQFDRIFANQKAIYDHFLTYYSFKVESWLPASRLFENFGPEQIQHGDSQLQVGGSQM